MKAFESLESRRLLAVHPGDVNGDTFFNSRDLVAMFQAGKFESFDGATYEEGDINGSGYFDTRDLVDMFSVPGYETGESFVKDPPTISAHTIRQLSEQGGGVFYEEATADMDFTGDQVIDHRDLPGYLESFGYVPGDMDLDYDVDDDDLALARALREPSDIASILGGVRAVIDNHPDYQNLNQDYNHDGLEDIYDLDYVCTNDPEAYADALADSPISDRDIMDHWGLDDAYFTDWESRFSAARRGGNRITLRTGDLNCNGQPDQGDIDRALVAWGTGDNA